MPLINLKCDKCGYETEELVRATGEYPLCPKCGERLTQNFSSKLRVNARKPKGCDGNCKHCGGCS